MNIENMKTSIHVEKRLSKGEWTNIPECVFERLETPHSAPGTLAIRIKIWSGKDELRQGDLCRVDIGQGVWTGMITQTSSNDGFTCALFEARV